MSESKEKQPLLKIDDLHVSFLTYAGKVQAVRGVSLSMQEGEILAIVGESGCGKSVTAQTILQLNPSPPSVVEGGSIELEGRDLLQLDDAKMRAIRDALGTQFCRRCNYCQPCSAGISISSVFLFEGYLSRYGLADWARSRYATLTKKASECIGCGACESRCPYHLPIRSMLKEAAEKFGE